MITLFYAGLFCLSLLAVRLLYLTSNRQKQRFLLKRTTCSQCGMFYLFDFSCPTTLNRQCVRRSSNKLLKKKLFTSLKIDALMQTCRRRLYYLKLGILLRAFFIRNDYCLNIGCNYSDKKLDALLFELFSSGNCHSR